MPAARRLLALIVAVTVVHPAAANPAFDSANKAHMESMDAYFTCAFAAMRDSRAKRQDSRSYLSALSDACADEERTLRARSASFAEARGMAPARARAKADAAVVAARRDLIRTYSGQ